MVYVFGWEVPLFDLLFILFAVLTASVILVWIELARLRKLILTEKDIQVHSETDIKRLENDLADLEGSKPKPKQVRRVVQSHINNGIHPKTIESRMLSRGWDKSTVRKTLQKVK